MIEDSKLGKQLEAAVIKGDKSELATIGETIDRYIFDIAAFPSPLFEKVISVIRGMEFCRLTDSVWIIKLFEYNLSLLTNVQRQQLFTTLSELITKLADPVSAFLTVELVAEIWCDSRSFESLLNLTKGASENTLALAAHGLGWLAKRTKQMDTQSRCLNELRLLSKHPSHIVQAEAITALSAVDTVIAVKPHEEMD